MKKLIFYVIMVVVMIVAVNRQSISAINSSHPRLFADRITTLRNKVAINDPTWVQFKARLDSGSSTAFELAVGYMASQNIAYGNAAIAKADFIVASGYSGPRSDSFLGAWEYVRDIAVTYDLCYTLLNSTQKSSYGNYMREIVYEIWNPGNSTYPWSGWAINDPGNNYHYGFLAATAYFSYATYGDLSEAETWRSFLRSKMDNDMIGWLTTYGKGGGWQEGENYREGAHRRMFELFDIVKTVEGADYFTSTNFAKECVLYTLYSIQPGGQTLYSGGDLSRVSYPAVSDYTREVVLKLAHGLEGTIEGRYAQYWLNNVYTLMGWNFQRKYDFIYDNPQRARSDYKLLPLTYFAEGSGWFNSRSGWGASDTSVSFVSTDLIQSHQHKDQNSFVLFRRDYQLIDATIYSISGLRQETDAHNCILINGSSQGFRDDNLGGRVLKTSNGSNYGYVVGDATNAYNHHGSAVLSDYKRELLHILPNVVVLADRIYPTSGSAARQILFHFAQQPVISSGVIKATNGTGKVDMKMVSVITDPTIINEHDAINSDYNSWRGTYSSIDGNLYITGIVVDDTSTNNNCVFTKINATSMDGSIINSTGIMIKTPGTEYAVIFRNNFNSIVEDSRRVQVTLTENVCNFFLSNLNPLQTYYYTLENSGGSITLSLSNNINVLPQGSIQNIISDSSGIGVIATSGNPNIMTPMPPNNLRIM